MTHREVDVLVVGFGAAGAAAAIAAHDAGARGAIVEKTSSGGGNCVHSGGFLFDVDGPRAVDHLDALCFGKTDRGVLEAYARGLPGRPRASSSRSAGRPRRSTWTRSAGCCRRGRTSRAPATSATASSFPRRASARARVCGACSRRAVREREIPVAFDTPVVDLALDGDAVAGAVVEQDGERQRSSARAGRDPGQRRASRPTPSCATPTSRCRSFGRPPGQHRRHDPPGAQLPARRCGT